MECRRCPPSAFPTFPTFYVSQVKLLTRHLMPSKTFRLRLRGSRRHNWTRRRLTSRAWTSSGPLECTLRLCLTPLHRAIRTRAVVASAHRASWARSGCIVGSCYVARLHVSLVSHHTSLPFQPATRRATSLSTVQQTSNRRTCPGANGFRRNR